MPKPNVENPTPRPPHRWPRLALSSWLPAVLALLCFANTIPNDFTYDDRPLILQNPRIASLANLRAIWLSDWWKLVENEAEANPQRDRLYRPLTLFSFALNYALHGYHPAGYHLANVLLHAAACVLVWHLARRWSGEAAVASLTAVIFAVHPVHVEAVASVVGRAEILATLFLLGGLLVLGQRRGLPGPGRGLLAALLFLLALLSKESAISYPAIALLWLYWMQREHPPRGRWWLAQTAFLVLPLLVYFPLRYTALEHRLFRTEPVVLLTNPIMAATGLQRVLAPLTVLGHYVRLLVEPASLSCDYGIAIVDPRHGVTPMTALGLVAAAGLATGIWGLTRRSSRWRDAGLLTTMFLASYALISNTVLLIGVSLAERFMYWPSVPLLLLLATGLVAYGRRAGVAGRVHLGRVLGVLLLAGLATRSLVRNTDWASNVRLFGADVRTHPEGAHLNKGYALELLYLWQQAPGSAQADAALETARHYLDRALQIHPGYVEALALRGQVRAQLGDVDGALLDVEAAIQLDPSNRAARRTLALLIHGPNMETRLAALRAGVAAHPEDAAAHRDFGRALLEYGQVVEAQRELEEAVRLAPGDAETLRELGKALALRQKDDQAIAVFARAATLAPDDWQIHANLATLLAQRRPTEALTHARRAYELKPGEPRNAINLAEAYALNGQTSAAVELYQKVERGLDKDDPLREVVAQRLEFLRAGL